MKSCLHDHYRALRLGCPKYSPSLTARLCGSTWQRTKPHFHAITSRGSRVQSAVALVIVEAHYGSHFTEIGRLRVATEHQPRRKWPSRGLQCSASMDPNGGPGLIGLPDLHKLPFHLSILHGEPKTENPPLERGIGIVGAPDIDLPSNYHMFVGWWWMPEALYDESGFKYAILGGRNRRSQSILRRLSSRTVASRGIFRNAKLCT